MSIESLLLALSWAANRTVLRGSDASLNGKQLLQQLELVQQTLAKLRARRVALALDNSAAWCLHDLALAASGLVCVPVPGFFSAGQQRHVLDSAGIDTLIGHQLQSGVLEQAGFVAVRSGIYQRTLPQSQALHAGTAKITYTSGTTGQPKGVCLSLETQLTVADSLRQATAGLQLQRHLCLLPLATLLENIAGVYAQWLQGAEVIVPSLAEIGWSGAAGLDVSRLLALLQREQPHSVILLPQLLLALVQAAEQGWQPPSSLRMLAVGGGFVSAQLLQRAERLGLPVWEGYGLSECASVVCLNTPQARRIGSVGQPLPHARVCLADDGELLVQGPRMLGYLGEAPLQGNWLHTGDLAREEDGFILLQGRKKHMFVTAYGRNVHPEWVEAELTQQPAIAQAWLHGEARASNVAVLVPRGAARDADLQAAVDGVNASLPDYARVHQWLRAEAPFSAAAGLLTDNGRLRRTALLQHFAPALSALDAVSSPTPV